MFDLKRFLTEHRTILREAEHGFDLTDFTPGGFQKVLQGLGIAVTPGKFVESKPGYGQWRWMGSGIVIITGNDPITGKYASPVGGRKDEKDYASYMGITGMPDKVKLAVDLIHKHASGIKDESNTRDFI